MNDFVYDALPGRVVFGAGRRAEIAREVDELGPARVMLIADENAKASADELADILADRVVARWDEVAQHVPTDLAEAARAAARDATADGIVCVGGGSTTGLAKAIALVADTPIVAVPTTYAGSEMTPIYGLTGEHKQTGRALSVLPRVVVYDPELTVSLPPEIAGPSGMNALAHAVEGLYAPGANPITSLLALESVRVLRRSLPVVCARPADLGGRTDALYGTYLAACALAVTGTALHHKTCHVLGGMFGLDHGGMNAVVLPHALRYNEPAIPDEYPRLRDALDGRDPVEALFDLARAIDAPRSLAQLGMPEEGVDAAVAPIVEANAANVRDPEPDLVRAMLRDAYQGHRPPAAQH